MKKINLIVTGGIAASKAKELYDLLIKKYEVKVILSKSAKHFIDFENIDTLSDVFLTNLLDSHTTGEHIKHTLDADLNIVYPATYNFIGKIANGIADEICSLTFSASDFKTLLFPSMNNRMYTNFIMNNNKKILLNHPQIKWIEPLYGKLASGHSGIGRALEPIDVLKIVDQQFLDFKNLINKKILINFGRTRSYLDSVRFITNSSSGKMGMSIYQSLKSITRNINVVYGDVDIDLNNLDNFTFANNNKKMLEEMNKHYSTTDVVICCAAPTDFEIKNKLDSKMDKKQLTKNLNLDLEDAVDILLELGKKKKNQFLVGFGLLDTFDFDKGYQKLINKNCDMLVLNTTKAMGSENNEVYILLKNKTHIKIETASKKEIAISILKHINDNLKKINH